MSRDDRRVPDGDTIFEFGSATKVLTGFLLADAVIQGQVKLDPPARELLPAGVKMPANGDRAITLQDLSTHVSGLPKIPDNMKFGIPDNPYADYREEHLYAFLNNHKLARPRGQKTSTPILARGCLVTCCRCGRNRPTRIWCGTGSPRRSRCPARASPSTRNRNHVSRRGTWLTVNPRPTGTCPCWPARGRSHLGQ